MSKNTLNGILGATSLMLLMTTTMVLISTPSVDAATGNATKAANQTGEKGQSMLNQTGEAAQSFMNKTGETLQKINPFK
jgi:hypothetical protein